MFPYLPATALGRAAIVTAEAAAPAGAAEAGPAAPLTHKRIGIARTRRPDQAAHPLALATRVR